MKNNIQVELYVLVYIICILYVYTKYIIIHTNKYKYINYSILII